MGSAIILIYDFANGTAIVQHWPGTLEKRQVNNRA
jgi:hypothetical protein